MDTHEAPIQNDIPEAVRKEEPVKNEELDSKALCATIVVIILSVFSLNVFLLLFGIFALVALHGTYSSWAKWERVVRIFYVVCFVILIIAIVIFFIYFIVGCVRKRGFTIAFSLAIIILSVFLMIYSAKANNAIKDLYKPPALTADKNSDPRYQPAVQADLQVPEKKDP